MIDIWKHHKETHESIFVQSVLSERAAKMLIDYYNKLNDGYEYDSVNAEYVGMM